ncbi:hypothetical protein ACJX0J_034025, partial [Zea mays]
MSTNATVKTQIFQTRLYSWIGLTEKTYRNLNFGIIILLPKGKEAMQIQQNIMEGISRKHMT